MEGSGVNRIVYIDAIRGWAILLVVIGHLIQYNYSSGIQNTLFNVIYSFHMPLFFFVSGMSRGISCSTKIADLKSLVTRLFHRFTQLIVPSISWTLLFVYFYNQYIRFSTLSSYWFLNTLFVIVLIWDTFLYGQLKFNIPLLKRISTCLMLVVLVGLFIADIKRVSLMYLMMYVGGYYFQKYGAIKSINPFFASLCAFLFVLLCDNFYYGNNEYGNPNRIWWQFPLSLCAIISSLYVFYNFSSNNSKIISILSYIGHYTLGVYLIHMMFVELPVLGKVEFFGPILIQFVLLLLCALVITFLCIGMQRIIKQFPLFNKLLLGK